MENIKIDSETLERMFIEYSLKNETFFLKIKDYLTTTSYKKKSYFEDTKNQLFFNYISRYWDKYNRIPEINTTNIFIERLEEDDEIKFLLSTSIEKYYEADVSNYNEKELYDEVRDFINKSRVQESMILAYADLQEGKVEGIPEKIDSAIVKTFNEDSSTVISSSFNREIIKNYLEEEKKIKKIETGYSYFDKIMNGGFRPGKLYCFAGPPGGGKSIVLQDFALNAVKAGNNVLFISIEMNESTLLNRVMLSILPYTYEDISTLNVSYSTEQESVLNDIEEAFKKLKGELTIEYTNNVEPNCQSIEKALKKKQYSMLVVDYIGIMEANTNENNDNPHFKFKEIAEELRSLGQKYNIPVITANQVNADAYRKQAADLANMAYSTAIGHTVDFLAFINNDSDELQIKKNRDGITMNTSLIMNKAKYKIIDIREKKNIKKEDEEIEKMSEENK